jgi:hypothetical protein
VNDEFDVWIVGWAIDRRIGQICYILRRDDFLISTLDAVAVAILSVKWTGMDLISSFFFFLFFFHFLFA